MAIARQDRLKSSLVIQELFQEGATLKAYPLVLRHRAAKSGQGLQVAVAVPRRKIKKAVQRNRIKRQLREAFRANRNLFPRNDDRQMVVLYLPSQELPFARIHSAFAKLAWQLHNAAPPKAV